MVMDNSTKKLLLHLHNQYRNLVAGGKLKNFPQASNMGIMQWDESLQEAAELHVSHCTFVHDQCRATPQFAHSGQNLAYQATSLGWPKNTTAAIERGVKGWFDEWKMAKPSIIKKLTAKANVAYHFTLMVNDWNNHLGCGMIKYMKYENKKLMNAFMLTCNYGYTNIVGEAVYRKGRPCSKCTHGCSSEYNALCPPGTTNMNQSSRRGHINYLIIVLLVTLTTAHSLEYINK